jgi:AmmeMemoRadiSam system protein B
MSPIREPAFAGSWYPGRRDRLEAEIDALLGAAADVQERVAGLVCPHAGLMYSGPVAAHGYRAVAHRAYELVVLVGPSHYVSFDGVAASRHAVFRTPLGDLPVDTEAVDALVNSQTSVFEDLRIHAREHALELQLPFLARVLPGVPLVPLLMGRQDRAACDRLATALERVLRGRHALVIASSDLSHFHDRPSARQLDDVVLGRLAAFDADGLQSALEAFDGHACGGGPMVVAMRTAAAHAAGEGRVLQYGDSGDVSGDLDRVVGYVSATFVASGERRREAGSP